METYKVDDSMRHVKVQVRVGVIGIPFTSVDLTRDRQIEFLFDSSENDKGDIELQKVDINRKLPDSFLTVTTIMKLSNLSDEQKKHAVDNISILYTLEGGPDGHTNFTVQPGEIDARSTRVIISKTIKFVAS